MNTHRRMRRPSSGLMAKALHSPAVAKLRYTGKFISSVIRLNGLREGVRLLQTVEKVRFALADQLGRVLANVLLSFAGSFNGCPFCAVGHLYGANLDYFAVTGKLFPLDEREIPSMHEMPFAALESFVYERLSGDEFVEDRRLIRRLFELRIGRLAESDEDKRLVEVLDVWAWMNECTIPFSYDENAEDIVPIVFEDVSGDLIRRYHAERAPGREA